MSAFRRLSFVGGSSDDSEELRPHQHRHPHLYRHKKDYSVSPTGGNRPISITADPRISSADLRDDGPAASVRRNSSRPDITRESPVRKHKSRTDITGEPAVRKHKSGPDIQGEPTVRKHKSRSDILGDDPVRKHSSRHSHSSRSRSDSAEEPVRKHSSRSRKRRSERLDTAPEVSTAVSTAAPVPVQPLVRVQAHRPAPVQVIDMSKTLSSSPPSTGSSMGIVISGGQPRSGSSESFPVLVI